MTPEEILSNYKEGSLKRKAAEEILSYPHERFTVLDLPSVGKSGSATTGVLHDFTRNKVVEIIGEQPKEGATMGRGYNVYRLTPERCESFTKRSAFDREGRKSGVRRGRKPTAVPTSHPNLGEVVVTSAVALDGDNFVVFLTCGKKGWAGRLNADVAPLVGWQATVVGLGLGNDGVFINLAYTAGMAAQLKAVTERTFNA